MSPERIVQDDARERYIAALCGLRHDENRAGADAYDEKDNPFELKSATKRGVSTARDVGLHTITQWRQKYWIVAAGRNLDVGFEIEEAYVLHPDDFETWLGGLEERLRADGRKVEEVLAAARRCGASEDALTRVEYLGSRGVTVNNPHIPMKVIRENGTALPHAEPARIPAVIRDFVRRRPLG